MDLQKDFTQGVCDPAEFRRIFEAEYKLLRNFLLFRYRDNHLADDMAQNAFVKLWENCQLLKRDQARSFLFTTGIRLSLNQFRHQKVVQDYALRVVQKTADRETPHALLEGQEFHQRLEAAIAALPEKQREVFLLNRFENLSYAEIAAALDLSVKAVEKRMHLALVALRKINSKI